MCEVCVGCVWGGGGVGGVGVVCEVGLSGGCGRGEWVVCVRCGSVGVFPLV